MVSPAGPAEAVQVGVESGEAVELFAVDPVGVDQHPGRPQGQLGVMTEKHLTHDSSRR